VNELEMSSEEPRTNETLREVEGLEEIMELQKMEEIASEKVSRGEDKGESTEREGMEPTGRTRKRQAKTWESGREGTAGNDGKGNEGVFETYR
jgi:hypothetical protein